MPEQTTAAPTWRCAAGTVVGRRDGPVVRATGIRYARAARFREPTAEPPATGPIEATGWAPACPQPLTPQLDTVLVDPMGGLTFDEDCLRLSVTAPARVPPGAALPVMVWIHGGSYTSAAGDAPIFDPAALVAEQQVVVVAVTYRLGLLGYLGGGPDRPANLGLLDQIEALRWVQRNVAAFGGDPANVTVFGQSAGGDAAAHLMVAEGTDGLFARVIVQSAPLGISRNRARMNAAMARAARGIPADAPVAEVVAAQARVAARARPFGLRAAMPFGTQYGRHPLPPEDAVDRAWERAAGRVDVLVGYNDREVALFTGAVPPLGRVLALPVLGPALRHGLVAALTRKVYGAGARAFAARHRRGGGRGYHYVLSWGAPGSPYAGAHCVDLPLLFGRRAAWEGAGLIAGATWEQVDAAGRELRGVWAEFARTGRITPTTRPGLVAIREI